jgi:hypothetical protein
MTSIYSRDDKFSTKDGKISTKDDKYSMILNGKHMVNLGW